LSDDIVITAMEGYAAIDVVFFSFPEYQYVTWTNRNTGESLASSTRHVLTTNKRETRRHEYIARMNITTLHDSDFTVYLVTVKNNIGYADYFVTLKNPKEGNLIHDVDIALPWNYDFI